MSLHENLRKLFVLDQQVRGMRKRLDSATGRLNALQAALEQYNQQCDELREQFKHSQAKASTLENQSNDIEQRIEHLREQMQSVKNNKEYSAVLLEVNTLKIDKGKIEDEALEQLSNVDRLKEEVQEIETRVTNQKKLVDGAQSEIEICRSEIGQELDELTAKRATAEQQIPEAVRAQFNRMAHIYEGEAMAEVIEESRRNKEYTCGGCYLSLPVERVNAVMIPDEQVVFCPSCGRILYIDQQLKASISSK